MVKAASLEEMLRQMQHRGQHDTHIGNQLYDSIERLEVEGDQKKSTRQKANAIQKSTEDKCRSEQTHSGQPKRKNAAEAKKAQAGKMAEEEKTIRGKTPWQNTMRLVAASRQKREQGGGEHIHSDGGTERHQLCLNAFAATSP